MNTKMQLTFIYCCLIAFTQLAAQPDMRFLNNNTLVIVDNEKEQLEILNAQENYCLSCIDLPKDSVYHSSLHCSLFCSPEEIFVVSNTRCNTLWQLNITNRSWKEAFSTEEIAPEYPYAKLYSSSNGQHLVCLGYKNLCNPDSDESKNKPYDKIIWCKNIAYDLCEIETINWKNVYDIQISNDGKALLILSYKHEPILIKDKKILPILSYKHEELIKNWEKLSKHELATLLLLSLLEKTTAAKEQAKLSPQGKYILIPSNEFLALYNTHTQLIDHVIRLKKDNIILTFPWNNTMNQFSYFHSQDEYKSAFKWCTYHICYDTCPDRLDYIGTPFCNLKTISSEISEDENRLLLVTQQTKPFEKILNTSVHIIDFKQSSVMWQATLDKIEIQAAAISHNGSMVALLDKEGNVMVKDLVDRMKD